MTLPPPCFTVGMEFSSQQAAKHCIRPKFQFQQSGEHFLSIQHADANSKHHFTRLGSNLRKICCNFENPMSNLHYSNQSEFRSQSRCFCYMLSKTTPIYGRQWRLPSMLIKVYNTIDLGPNDKESSESQFFGKQGIVRHLVKDCIRLKAILGEDAFDQMLIWLVII